MEVIRASGCRAARSLLLRPRATIRNAQLLHYSTTAPLREQTSSRNGQQWLQALESAPCLVCGGATTHRVDCAVSGFPLTCSSECDRTAVAERYEELEVFQHINEDLVYSASADARTLLTTVITRQQRLERQAAAAESTSTSTIQSWEEFARRFTDDPQWLDDPRAMRLLSAAYTFVMTLSHYLPPLCAGGPPPRKMELHVVGARAEAMMPRPIWEELVDSHPTTEFTIKLVGDHVPALSRKHSRAASTAAPSRLNLEFYPGLYHQVVRDTEAQMSPAPDAFVLFNPGIGHPRLREAWRPTMEMILQSGKPALLTSFSLKDQERDLDALRALSDGIAIDFLLPPQENPFRSRCSQLEPSDVFAPIQGNSHAVVVRGRGQT